MTGPVWSNELPRSCRAGPYSSLETELKVEETWVPKVVTAPMMTTAMSAAMSAYSIAVTARRSFLESDSER